MTKRILVLLVAMVWLLLCCLGISAYADETVDNTALMAVLGRIESYEAADYTEESYAPLATLYSTYSQQVELMENQEDVDLAVTRLLSAMSELRAYLKLTVSADTDVTVMINGDVNTAGSYTAVYGAAVTLSAPQVDNAQFVGWYETVSRRILSTESTYAFRLVVNTSLKAIYKHNETAVLSFRSVTGQIFAEYERTVAEWAQTDSLDALCPENVPYHYGYTNGRWAIDDSTLATLMQGDNVTVTPEYDKSAATEWSAPVATEEVVLKLHYRYDNDKDIGSFVMKAAIPQDITLQSVGMLFYYKKADIFNPATFDVNNNNKMLVSQYDILNKDTYITNMKKLSKYSWAVRGYAAYEMDGKQIMVYSNQVNIVNTEDIHLPISFPETAATCTEGGLTGGVYCDICGQIFEKQTAVSPLGHDLGEWIVETEPAVGKEGLRRRSCSRCDYSEAEAIPALAPVDNIAVKLPNTDAYLYRAGNANNVALSSLFREEDDSVAVDSSEVGVTVTNIAGSAAGAYTANMSDWSAGTLRFSGLGVVKVTVTQYGNTAAELYLEIVHGINYVEGAMLANITSNNAVLLGDVNCKKITINNGKTLYGNGFSVTDTRTDFSGAGNAYITMNGGGSVDNAKLLGKVYPTLVTSGQENQYYAPGVWITGDANIYNSYVSETKNAVQIDAGNVYFENSTFAGGALANIDIGGGNVTLKNCVTSTTDRGGLNGLGVHVKTAHCKINLEGSFTQYNYLKKAQLPDAYSGIFSSVYNDSAYAYTNGGNTYVNMGVFFFTETGNLTQAQAQSVINDQTTNSYGYIQKTALSITATVYTRNATDASMALLTTPTYDETVNGQYPIPAAYAFDYTNKNYIAKTDGSNRYCYYDNTTKQVMISFDKDNDSSVFSWDPMILTAKKNGNTLCYTVLMNGIDYTNRTISFADSGDYTVTYSYTDPYNYGSDGTPFSKTYTKTVNINVTAVEPDDVTYNASFAYDGAAGNYAAKKVIGTDSKTYVMPDVTTTSDTIGKTTVAGQTVYYPIVQVNPTASNGNSAYSSGKIYYFAPVFSELHIIDYNQETGEKQYEYSKSTTKWPHNKNATAGPDTAYFTCASGEKTWSNASPYGRSMNAQYYKYGSNSLGVCYTSEEIEKDNAASTHLVQYHYVSNDGTTYYYYIQYKFGAATYVKGSCVTDGTLVTMADGTKKPIEDIQVGDMVMTWSMWKGCYEAQPVVLHWYHGTTQEKVLTLHFSDGTAVRTVNQHGFFNADKNTYAYLTNGNVSGYVGDRFVKQLPDGTNTVVILTDYTITEERVGSYSIQTAYNENFIVENMLSMTGEDFKGRFEYFAIGDGMKYDEEQMQADIARYGLYSYEEFADYLTPEQFEMFNGAYFKVLVGKGVFTYEQIFEIIGANL